MSAKVLLVDDEVEFTSVLAERLEARGLEVDTVDSGVKALEQVQEGGYDAIILDLAMPELDGIETMKRLLEDDPNLQVILLTGHATLEKGVEAVKSGAVEFIEKPAKLDVLLEKIRKAQTQRVALVQRQMEDTIADIVGHKGW